MYFYVSDYLQRQYQYMQSVPTSLGRLKYIFSMATIYSVLPTYQFE